MLFCDKSTRAQALGKGVRTLSQKVTFLRPTEAQEDNAGNSLLAAERASTIVRCKKIG
jgi:hypothetical protein